jgi:hypothetical protein
LRKRRAGLAAGAAVGAFALAAPAAQAANFEVNTLSDAPADGCTTDPNGCTLRDAVTDANNTTGADLITFQSGLSGTVTLTNGQLALGGSGKDGNPVTIVGGGAIKVSGDADGSHTNNVGDSRIFSLNYISPSAHPRLNLSGLTLSGGYVSSGSGGAIYLGDDAELSVTDSTLTDSAAVGSGGAIGTDIGKYSSINISNSTISNNTALAGGGISNDGPLTLDHSTVSGNHATSGSGGGVDFGAKYGPLRVTGSTISGNTSTGSGGGLGFFPSSNPSKYTPGDNEISNTTISGNSASSYGAGLFVNGIVNTAGTFTMSHSTISGNTGDPGSFGGGIQFGGSGGVNGSFKAEDSTISGNSAGVGGGVSIHPSGPTYHEVGPSGSLSFDNSTIASNTATTKGGGFYLGAYGPSPGPYTNSASIPLNSTIIGDNKANGSSNDLEQADPSTSGGFELFLSLAEALGTPVLTATGSIIGSDPQLGALANNGGPTRTMLPAATSPAIDAGGNIFHLATDQRGDPRTVDLGPPDATDGTDIGAVERAVPPPPPVPGTGQPPASTKKKCKKHKKHKRSAQSAKKKKCKKHKKKH